MSCDCKMIHPPDGRKKRNLSNGPVATTPTYKIWIGIRARCRETASYHLLRNTYAGVKISTTWSEEFSNFLRDMGTRPFPMASVDRKDGNKGYCKHNCRWATKYEQAINKRRAGYSSSVCEGVRLKKSGAFEARITVLGRIFHIGVFKTKKQAEAEYKRYREFIYRD